MARTISMQVYSCKPGRHRLSACLGPSLRPIDKIDIVRVTPHIPQRRFGLCCWSQTKGSCFPMIGTASPMTKESARSALHPESSEKDIGMEEERHEPGTFLNEPAGRSCPDHSSRVSVKTLI
jgi:hypothetical protein